MKTLAQVRTQAVDDHTAAFLTRLQDRVETQQITAHEATAYQARIVRAQEIANSPTMMQELEPGIWDVWSTGKDMSKVWTVGRTCNCPDADTAHGGKAPLGHCKHRLAVWLRRCAEKDIRCLEARLEGIKLPHTHTYACGHEGADACYDQTCTAAQEDRACASCSSPSEEGTMDPEETMPAYNEQACAEAPVYDPPTQYEPAPVLTPKLVPPCEALSSFNLKAKRGNCEAMWTLRSVLPGAQGDEDIIARLPRILEQLRQLGFNITNE